MGLIPRSSAAVRVSPSEARLWQIGIVVVVIVVVKSITEQSEVGANRGCRIKINGYKIF